MGREGSLQDHPGVLCADVKCAIGDGVRDRAVVGSSPFAPQQDRSKSFAGIGRALVEALPFRPDSRVKALEGHFDPDFHGWDLDYPDAKRADRFIQMQFMD